MNINITAQDMYQELMTLPNDSLAEIWQFIEFVKYKKQPVIQESHPIKLGGLWRDYNVDITENDIKEARREMWSHLGELNE
ncbi:hypothetical protein BGP_5314 [Beggiatoa sp. PS]|nr:hypothetical protein BGP_5314 [Beggiatoa sp. PS]